MAVKGKIIFWFFAASVVFLTFFIINRQLKEASDAVNEVVETTKQPGMKRSIPVLAPQAQDSPAEKPAILIVTEAASGITKPSSGLNKEKVVFAPQEEGVSAGIKQSRPASGLNPGVSIKKDPTKAEIKEMDSKGIIIF
ncbi:MAG: hypothetical protein V1869_06890 [Candidatus Omnitrophota bacterium]